jgi:hypothetical protein
MAYDLQSLRAQLTADGGDEKTWDRLLACFGEESLANISRYAALMLTPDFAPQGLMRPLFEWFERWGCLPVAAVPHCFNPAEITLLYAGRVTHRSRKGRMHSSWLSPRLYGLGASVLLILRGTDGAEPLQERIRRDKGISRYGEHTSEHLRGISRIADRCISLVHSPDDYEGFLHLTELVIGMEAAAAALRPGRETISEEHLSALAPKVDLAAEPHPFDLLLRLMQQGVALVIADPMAHGPTLLPRELFRAVGEERGRLNDLASDRRLDADPWRLETQTWRSLSRLAPQLAALTAQQSDARDASGSWDGLKVAHARLELCRVMQEMCARESFDPRLSHDIVEIFRRNHLALDAWDEQRLHVLAAFHGRDTFSDASPELVASADSDRKEN